ncbi:hypothetical protein ABER02_12530 [Rossellomorea marisflavi]|uniref:hypothetical protein n=1 Tax=Rossellomorea marisflavi TaxID=189381 RepID=UPI0012E211BE|nr:hypothetical protein [Rossellomorea marisflavi]
MIGSLHTFPGFGNNPLQLFGGGMILQGNDDVSLPFFNISISPFQYTFMHHMQKSVGCSPDFKTTARTHRSSSSGIGYIKKAVHPV